MVHHEEFTAEQIQDILREKARERATKTLLEHKVPDPVYLVRHGAVDVNVKANVEGQPTLVSATVSWPDPT